MMLMNFRPVKPVRRVRRPQDPLDRMVNDLFKSFEKDIHFKAPVANLKRQPAVNVLENEDAFLLEIAAPGFNKDQFEMKVEKDVLTIEAKASRESETPEQTVYKVREFVFNDFKKAFTLPEIVNVEVISAKFEDGILTVTLPKKEEAKPLPPKQIEIA